MLDAIDGTTRADRQETDDEAKRSSASELHALVAQMRALYGGGDRSSPQMMALREGARRLGMSSDAIDRALGEDHDAEGAEPTAPGQASGVSLFDANALSFQVRMAPASTPPATREASERARYETVAALPPAAADRGAAPRSVASYVKSVEDGHATYMRMAGLTADDVRGFAVQGALPDSRDSAGRVIATGAERLQTLEAQAHGGSWPAANAVVHLIDARRAALSAERADLESKARRGALADRAAPDPAIADSAAIDRQLLALRQHTHADVSEATARFAAHQLQAAQSTDRQAVDARARGDETAAVALEAKARELRAHAAKTAYGDARFRAGSPALGLGADGSFATAAEAQIDEGRAQIEDAKRGAERGVAIAEAPPAALTDADSARTGNGVPGAARILEEGRRAGMSGHAPLALETQRQGAIAEHHKAHVDRARSAGLSASPEHRAGYLAARGEQAKALDARDRLYQQKDATSAGDVLAAARVREQKRDVLTELADAADGGTRVRTAIAGAREQRSDAEGELAAATKALGAAGKRLEAADANELAARDEADPLFGNAGKSARQIARARDGLDDASTLRSDAAYGFAEARAHVARLESAVEKFGVRDRQLQSDRVAADADSIAARDALAGVLANAGGSPEHAAAAARTEADLAAASQRRSLDTIEGSRPNAQTRGEIARQRAGLGGYYAGAAETARMQRGAGMDGYVDQAHAELARADGLRRTLPAGAARDSLTLQAIDVRARLAETEVAKRPNDATSDLSVAETAAADLHSGVAGLAARARVGAGAVTSLARLDLETPGHGAVKDALFAQAHRTLDAIDARDPAAAAAKRQLETIDDGLAAVSTIVASSEANVARGAAVARAEVRTTGRAEGATARGSISGVVHYGALSQSFGRVDLRGAIDDAIDGAVGNRLARIDSDAASARDRVATMNALWQDGVRDRRPFTTLERVRGLVEPARGAGSIGDDAPLLATLRQPITSLPTIANRYASTGAATFTSGARGAVNDAYRTAERTAQTAAPVAYASLAGEAALAAATGGVGLLGEIGSGGGAVAGVAATLGVGVAMAGTGVLARKAFGADSTGTELVELALSFVPSGGGAAVGARSVAAAAKHAAVAGGEALAVAAGTELAARASGIDSEEGRAALGILMSLAPGALRAGRAAAARVLEPLGASEPARARVRAEFESFAQKTQGRMPTGGEVQALKDALYQHLGVSTARPETAKLRASIEANVDAFAYSRPLQRALTEMNAQLETLSPEQMTELTKRTIDQLMLARGLSLDAARAEAMRVLRPVVALASVTAVPALVVAMESEAGAAVRVENVAAFKAGAPSGGSRAVLRRLFAEQRKDPAVRTNGIRLALAVTYESAARIEARLQGAELTLLKDAAREIGRGAAPSAEHAAALDRLRAEVIAADPGSSQRAPCGKHWASVDLTFAEYEGYYAKMGGTPRARAELQVDFDAGKRLNPETGHVVNIAGKAVYATTTDVLPLAQMKPSDRAAIEAVLARRATIEAQLRALEGDPQASKKQIDQKRFELTLASEKLGEVGADADVRTRFAGPPEPKMLWPVDGANAQPGEFDRVWEVTTKDGPKILLVEAKGNGSQLGERAAEVGGAVGNVEQGTRHYANDIIASTAKNLGAEGEQLAKRIKEAKLQGRLMYVEARTTTHSRVQSREFDLSVNTGLRKP